MDVRKAEHFRHLLEEKRKELEAMSKVSSDARKPVALDQQSIGRLSRQDALQQQAMAKAQDARRVIDIKRINAALAKIKNDEFGWCADCGEEIELRRLEIDPMAEVCVKCAGAR